MEKDKKSHTKTIHLKYLGQPGMEILNYIPDDQKTWNSKTENGIAFGIKTRFYFELSMSEIDSTKSKATKDKYCQQWLSTIFKSLVYICSQ